MYTVLIVDDEEPVLESYSYLIETALEDFSVCGTARSGSEAIAATKNHHPDVVLMDIAMPGIDGLDTLGELQRLSPDILCILSTAYERFDIAQRAIPLQVFAYLVKPVSRKRFTETMWRAKAKIDEQRARASRRLEAVEHSQETLQREAHEAILTITWQRFDDASWSHVQHLFQISSDYGLVLVLESDQHDIYRTVARLLERRYRCLWSEHAQRMVVFVSGSVDAERLRSYLQNDVIGTIDPLVTIGFGIGSVRRYDKLFRSFDEALQSLPSRDGDTDSVVTMERHIHGLSSIIERARLTNDPEEVDSAYRALSEFVFQRWVFPVATNRIGIAIHRFLRELEHRIGDARTAIEISDPPRDIVGFRSREDVDAWARRILRRIIETQSRFGPSQWPQPIQRAVRYIESHFREPLQLTTVADYCGVSPGYLSRLFSEHVSVSFIDFLNSIRIDAARSLLDSGETSIKNVSYSVGYRDPNYFGRIFKRFTGVSPSEYGENGGHSG